RRLHAVRARGEARTTRRYDQVTDVRRPRALARPAGRARQRRTDMGTDTVHDLTAAYALDALDVNDRREYEAHLAHCGQCRTELVSLSEAATALAYGVAGPQPPPQLRTQILERARAERPNVVPLRPRWAVPAAVAAAAAVAATIALAIWVTSLSNRVGS